MRHLLLRQPDDPPRRDVQRQSEESRALAYVGEAFAACACGSILRLCRSCRPTRDAVHCKTSLGQRQRSEGHPVVGLVLLVYRLPSECML